MKFFFKKIISYTFKVLKISLFKSKKKEKKEDVK